MSACDLNKAHISSNIAADLKTILMSVFESTSNGVLIVDASGTIVTVNPAFTKITGYAASEVVGKSPNVLNSGRQNKIFYKSMWDELNTQGKWEGEIWNRRKDGEIYPEWLSITSVPPPMGSIEYFVGTFSDISSIKTDEDKLIQLAFYDPLTSLPNRVLFHDRLSHTLAHAQREENRFAVIFIDLDGFKNINDSYGHLAGDTVLLETAGRLKGCVRASDTVARLAGDEFTIIADKVSSISDITTVAINIMNVMAADFTINGQRISCGISIGISVYPESGDNAATLLENADTAMYGVKKAGKNGFRFHALPGQRRVKHQTRSSRPATNILPQTSFIQYRAGQK